VTSWQQPASARRAVQETSGSGLGHGVAPVWTGRRWLICSGEPAGPFAVSRPVDPVAVSLRKRRNRSRYTLLATAASRMGMGMTARPNQPPPLMEVCNARECRRRRLGSICHWKHQSAAALSTLTER